MLSSLNNIFSSFYRKYLEKSGTVGRLRKLYMRLRFQNEMMSIRKYEKKETLSTE